MHNASPLRGICLTVAAMACFAAMTLAVRWVAHTLPSPQIVFLRNVLSLAMTLSWAFTRGHTGLMRTQRLKGHFWRASIGFSAMELWFYSLTIMPLALATALSFTTPVFVALLAIWLFKEKAGWRRWSAIGTSCLGVLVILQPDTQGLSVSASIVLLASLLMACSVMMVKSLTHTERPETIVFYMALFMTPLSLPLALMNWQPLELQQWLGLALIASLSTAAHLLVTRSYTHADMVVLMPFEFTRLVFAGLLAWLIFGETVNGNTLWGALIILAAAVYIVHREAARKSGRDALPVNEGQDV